MLAKDAGISNEIVAHVRQEAMGDYGECLVCAVDILNVHRALGRKTTESRAEIGAKWPIRTDFPES